MNRATGPTPGPTPGLTPGPPTGSATGPATSSAAGPWWRTGVVYQIYVRSFADSDGDGLGDLEGIRSRLPYLAELGVDAIWLTPVYPSPQVDGGYDVADYRDIDPRFGRLEGFDTLLAEVHRGGLRLVMDLVPNHTSSEHPWFRAALAAGPASPERARYLFRDGRGRDGDEPPNDWRSTFGGPAWSRVTEAGGAPGQWYLHLFTPEQPDLDWTNDEVRAEFDATLRFWLDRGVDGFRIDVAHGLAKDPGMPDLSGRFPPLLSARRGHPHWDRDEVHEVYRRWRRITDAYDGQRALIAEAWVDGPERLARYVRSDELHTAFEFDFLLAPWDARAVRQVIDRTAESFRPVGGAAMWVLSNHDVVRHLSRYGDGESGTRRAGAAALLMLALPGGACLYQGEELGLPQVTDLPTEVLRDPTFALTGGAHRGRDGCRVPLPWSGRAAPFGFGPSSLSWLPQPAGWAALTAERQASEPASMLNLYRRALRLRRQLAKSAGEQMTWMETRGDVLAFRRGPGFACVVNFGSRPAPAPEELHGVEPLLSSTTGATSGSRGTSGSTAAAGYGGPAGTDRRIPAETAVWYGARRQGR